MIIIYYLITLLLSVVSAFAISIKSLTKIPAVASWILGVLAGSVTMGGLILLLRLNYLKFNFEQTLLSPTLFRDEVIYYGFCAVISLVLVGIFFLLNRKTQNIWVLSGISIIYFAIWGVFIAFVTNLFNPCDKQPFYDFHYFHDHLISLCVNRDDLAECPRDTSQLGAFNPKRWNRVNQCAHVTYSFDEKSQKYFFSLTSNGITLSSSTEQGQDFTYQP